MFALLSTFPLKTRNTPEPMPTIMPHGPYMLSIQPEMGSLYVVITVAEEEFKYKWN